MVKNDCILEFFGSRQVKIWPGIQWSNQVLKLIMVQAKKCRNFWDNIEHNVQISYLFVCLQLQNKSELTEPYLKWYCNCNHHFRHDPKNFDQSWISPWFLHSVFFTWLIYRTLFNYFLNIIIFSNLENILIRTNSTANEKFPANFNWQLVLLTIASAEAMPASLK